MFLLNMVRKNVVIFMEIWTRFKKKFAVFCAENMRVLAQFIVGEHFQRSAGKFSESWCNL